MNLRLKILIMLVAASSTAYAQVVPAATAGPASFGYSLNYAESAEFGSELGDFQTALLSGNLHYRSGFARAPFAVNYGGGYTFTIAGPNYATGYNQHIMATQALVWKKWSVQFFDNLSLLPQSVDTGFSDIPGSGEPPPPPPSDESILTLRTRSVDNFLGTGFRDRLGLGTSLNATVSWGLLRYPDGRGIDVNTVSADTGLSQRLSARMSVHGSYAFSQFSYPGHDLALTSNTLFAGFTRNWNRSLSTSVSGGPQWVNSSNSVLIPRSTNFAIRASARYRLKNLNAGVAYMRGVTGGAGYLFGAQSDVLTGTLSRGFGRYGTIGLEGAYARNAFLGKNGVITSEDVGVQASRRLGRHISVFVGYTVLNQGSDVALPSNVLGSLLQSANFGFSFIPRETRFNQ